MGIFKDAIGAVGKVFGLKQGSEGAPQFNIDTSLLDSDIAAIRKARDRDITDVRQSGQLQLDLLRQREQEALGDISRAGAQGLATTQQQLATTGGLSAGAQERLARQQNQSVLREQQRAGGIFAQQETGIRAADIAGQEAIKNQALFSTPQLQAIPLELKAQAEAANARARAVQAEANRKRFGALGSIAGTVIGAGLGAGSGPAGMAAGAQIGGSVGGGLFSLGA